MTPGISSFQYSLNYLSSTNPIHKIYKNLHAFFSVLAHKLKPYMAYINWAEQTAIQIDRQYRALHEIVS